MKNRVTLTQKKGLHRASLKVPIMGWTMAPKMIEVLTPGPYECDLTSKWGLWGCNQFKMSWYWIRWALIQCAQSPYKDKKKHKNKHERERAVTAWTQDSAIHRHQPRRVWSSRKLGDSSSRGQGQNMALWTPWFQTSSLLSYERIHFCCSKSPTFLWQP